MRKKAQKTIFIFFGLLLLNFIGNTFYKRFDLTQDKRYSIHKITSKTIDNVTENLFITVYLKGNLLGEFKQLQIETRQFLEELQMRNSNIKFRFINPNKIRKQLIKKGMIPSKLTIQENGMLSEVIIFPWAEIHYKNKTESICLLPNIIVKSEKEQLQKSIENLEFEFAEGINNITKKRKQKIAVLSGNGELQDIYLYSFLKEVSKKYHLAKFTLDSVVKNPQKTLQELTYFDLIIISKPTQKFTSKEKFTLDQFITNGGKTLWMLDNVQADQDSLFNNGKMLAYPRDLNLNNLLFSYGVRINYALIKDLYSAKIALATGNIGNQTQFQNLNWFYHPLVNGNPNHPITKNISPVRLQFANQIDTLKNSIKKTPLLASSVLTQKVGVPQFIELQSIGEKPTQNTYKSGEQLFAVLLEGKFLSAYKHRIKPFKTPLFKPKSNPNKMIVISDGDIAKNQILKGKPYHLSIDKWTGQQFGNKEFLLNCVDYLLDHHGLISLRTKSLQINTLDANKIHKQRTFWQFINIIMPLAILFLFGFVFTYMRKRKYSQKL